MHTFISHFRGRAAAVALIVFPLILALGIPAASAGTSWAPGTHSGTHGNRGGRGQQHGPVPPARPGWLPRPGYPADRRHHHFSPPAGAVHAGPPATCAVTVYDSPQGFLSADAVLPPGTVLTLGYHSYSVIAEYGPGDPYGIALWPLLPAADRGSAVTLFRSC